MQGTYQMQVFFHSNDPFESTIHTLDMDDSRHVKPMEIGIILDMRN